MNFESIQQIVCEVFCQTGMNPDSASNGIIKSFRKKLEALRLQDKYDHLTGRMISLEDFSWNQPTPNLLNVSWKSKWNVCDNGKSGSAIERFNNQTKALVSKMIHSVKIHENNITMRILDVNYR